MCASFYPEHRSLGALRVTLFASAAPSSELPLKLASNEAVSSEIPGGTSSEPLTLEAALQQALAQNRDLAAAFYAVQQAEGRLVQAGLWPNPEFEISHQNDRVFADEGEFGFAARFRQRFQIAGRLSKAENVARVDVAMTEVREHERLLAGEVLDLGREVLVTQQRLFVNQDLQSTLQSLVEVSEKRLSAAEVSTAYVNIAKLELQKLKLAQAALLNQREVATTGLNGSLILRCRYPASRPPSSIGAWSLRFRARRWPVGQIVSCLHRESTAPEPRSNWPARRSREDWTVASPKALPLLR